MSTQIASVSPSGLRGDKLNTPWKLTKVRGMDGDSKTCAWFKRSWWCLTTCSKTIFWLTVNISYPSCLSNPLPNSTIHSPHPIPTSALRRMNLSKSHFFHGGREFFFSISELLLEDLKSLHDIKGNSGKHGEGVVTTPHWSSPDPSLGPCFGQ